MGFHLVTALVGEPVPDWVQLLIATATVLLGALGLAYWAYRAQSDRSALVGLYLLFGIPAVLLLLAGVAVLLQGDRVLGPLLLLIGLGLGLPLLRPFRQALARVTPLDPDSAIDMTGLCTVLGLLGFFIGTSLAPMADDPPELVPSVGIVELLVQAAAFVAIAYIAVGFPYWRDLRATTDRLGIVAPDLRTMIGEEAIFRGALQPRYGIIIPSLLFTMLHGPQYGFNVALLGLLAVSVILGLLRKHLNTTAAMITHALFNGVQVLALSAMS
ncbi:MAG: Abortive infection protein [Thermomicrobiales bacterium]|nr:Abortive infection protein [Thermomicrobiales bacterium]